MLQIKGTQTIVSAWNPKKEKMNAIKSAFIIESLHRTYNILKLCMYKMIIKPLLLLEHPISGA